MCTPMLAVQPGALRDFGEDAERQERVGDDLVLVEDHFLV